MLPYVGILKRLGIHIYFPVKYVERSGLYHYLVLVVYNVLFTFFFSFPLNSDHMYITKKNCLVIELK